MFNLFSIETTNPNGETILITFTVKSDGYVDIEYTSSISGPIHHDTVSAQESYDTLNVCLNKGFSFTNTNSDSDVKESSVYAITRTVQHELQNELVDIYASAKDALLAMTQLNSTAMSDEHYSMVCKTVL